MQVWGSETSGSNLLAADATGTTVTVAAGGTTIGDGTNKAAIGAALTNAGLDTTKIKCVSKTKWTSYSLKFTVDGNGAVKVEYTPADIATE